ncbi:MAG TPA: succinate dehydrogenase assembly factor 2 [Gammaproteobacteria bacterium]|nr:succinate dehydrogenase assembly factor 2 [Gammaproteobacteria bacterium]
MERRLRWQCRRGLLELDLLLLRFVDEQYFTLDADNQQVFQALLKLPDQTLLSWVQGQEIPADEFKNIIINITQ